MSPISAASAPHRSRTQTIAIARVTSSLMIVFKVSSLDCAYLKGICGMCGVKLYDVSLHRQRDV